MAHVFITGATGYLGRKLIAALLARGHTVRGLVRPGSEQKLPAGCEVITGDALNADSYQDAIAPCDTFIHLVGVPHPNPLKAKQFQTIDLASAKIAVNNARASGIRHFIYVSVAQPAPIMQSYIAARMAAEQAIHNAGLNATILRPWYVLGPSHRWPYLFMPIIWLLERLPVTRATALRLGFVTLEEMAAALCHAVESPVSGMRIATITEIREWAR
jgi:nucleoside-diphosphate-sugar epimerase